VNFEHRRTTRRQGIYERLSLAAFFVVVVLVYRLFFNNPWAWERGFQQFIIVVGLLGVAIAGHAVWQIASNREFVCRIDGEIIECIAPDRFSGNNFRLRIADIVKIEKSTRLESYWWYLRDKDGNRYWLTSNFGNPIHKFLNAIEEINPAIVEVEVPD